MIVDRGNMARRTDIVEEANLRGLWASMGNIFSG